MIYLKATDEATFTAALKTAGWAWDTEYRVDVDIDTGEETVTEDVIIDAGSQTYSHTHSLDIIGTIHLPTGNDVTVEATDEREEYTYPEIEAITGWHANLLLHGEELPEALADMVIEEPSNPNRRFA